MGVVKGAISIKDNMTVVLRSISNVENPHHVQRLQQGALVGGEAGLGLHDLFGHVPHKEDIPMNSEKKSFLAEFSRRAVQRLQDKKVPKYRTLHIPSLATDMRFRNPAGRPRRPGRPAW